MLENKDFNEKEFKEIISSSDIEGIQYLYDNEIKYYNRFIQKQNYIYNLYVATCSLNQCNDYYEHEIGINLDIYKQVRNTLLTELGFDIEKLYN